MTPKYPIFIISKGRSDCCYTADSLLEMNVPFRIVLEACDYDLYAAVYGEEVLLTLPFENLGFGSIPARNWLWQKAIDEGSVKHWIMDDNIKGFYRMNYNRRIRVGDGTTLACAEEFTDRYMNVAFAGLHYMYFAADRDPRKPPYYLNTRVYSILLIRNDLPYRWRGRYNEDTDICLRALKDGWCTLLFNAFLANKITTLIMKGGNTDTVYATGDHRREFAESLKRQHPDVVEIVWRYERWHHQVDYSKFRNNKLKLKPEITPTKDVNEHGMFLKKVLEDDQDAED